MSAHCMELPGLPSASGVSAASRVPSTSCTVIDAAVFAICGTTLSVTRGEIAHVSIPYAQCREPERGAATPYLSRHRRRRKQQKPARPDARPQFSGPPPMDKVRPENQSEHTPVGSLPVFCDRRRGEADPVPQTSRPKPPQHSPPSLRSKRKNRRRRGPTARPGFAAPRSTPPRAREKSRKRGRPWLLALIFGPDFIHWRRSGKSWPRVD